MFQLAPPPPPQTPLTVHIHMHPGHGPPARHIVVPGRVRTLVGAGELRRGSVHLEGADAPGTPGHIAPVFGQPGGPDDRAVPLAPQDQRGAGCHDHLVPHHRPGVKLDEWPPPFRCGTMERLNESTTTGYTFFMFKLES